MMSKRALIIIAPGCEEIETVTSIDTLVRGNVKVTVASINPNKQREVVASRGVHLVADHLLEEVAHETFDAIVLPGGLPGAEYLRDNPLVIELLKKQHAKDLSHYHAQYPSHRCHRSAYHGSTFVPTLPVPHICGHWPRLPESSPAG